VGRETAIWLLGFVWITVIGGGFWAWERYEATPGSAGQELASAEQPATGSWRLIIFAHPHCSCTWATFHEVAEIAAVEPRLCVRVLFVCPPGSPEGWVRSEGWEYAARIPGAEVGCDVNGTEARRFGATTSGHAVLTDPEGRIVFRGGLTRARGREGISAGRRAVLDWVAGRKAVETAPVFGCALFDSDE
jgi:hypothetical protein